MALKAMLFLVASFLLVTTRVSSNDDEFNMKATYAKAPMPAPVHVPVKAPAPAPQVEPPTIAPRPPVKTREDCIPQCAQRCSLHSRKNRCERACMTCCERCKCVPPGTYGNWEMCGKCYTDMTTRDNKHKCP